jgi:DNA/RNA-binding domain of Phe-tRNA-synthetase-like protein
MRLGSEGESYPGIRKDEVNVGGRITVADMVGAFGNPTSDSARTMVTPSATELLIVVYAPAEIDKAQLERVVAATAERFEQIAGGRSAGSSAGPVY